MNSIFYLSRKLYDGNKNYSEAELLASSSSKFNVILAEPGVGKTCLLESLAKQLDTKKVSANAFIHKTINERNKPLVIDGFDELVRIDQSGIYKLLGKISELEPSTLFISSRSSEWDEACTNAFSEFFNEKPNIYRISPFNREEQQKLFWNYLPSEHFESFRSQVSRFDLEQLLPNPQFLKLFAEAYVESDRTFKDKKSIFSLAIDRLAKEANPNIRNNLSTNDKVELAENIFAKLLLSGAEGVSTSDVYADRLFPRIETLIATQSEHLSLLLSSKLFKHGDNESQHLPAHKIIAEYCAANYLVKKMMAEHSCLSLSQCLAIIAPNSVVRDELRGLVGWMGALGNKLIQTTLIDLDPYAVLSNGDPSQLLISSKKLLLDNLKKLAENDPYFRRSDIWRTFSGAGFFTEDFIEELKPIIIDQGNHGHLRGLILELLQNSKTIPFILNELEHILFSQETEKYIRQLASKRLLEVEDYDFSTILDTLLTEGSNLSLSIAAFIIENLGTTRFENSFIFNFLNQCSKLYPDHNKQEVNDRYFIKVFISKLDLNLTVWLLNELTQYLNCACGKEDYECYCRNGISKISGSLLDRYFELETKTYDPVKIGNWMKQLNFHRRRNEKDCLSVKTLQQNDNLRQSIIRLAFENVAEIETANKLKGQFLGPCAHSGLFFKYQDYFFITDLAFEKDNVQLWLGFIQLHQYYAEHKGEDPLRKHMRSQAQTKPIFLSAWMKKNLAYKRQFLENKNIFKGLTRSARKSNRQNKTIKQQNIKYVQDNRELVESGQHWGCLQSFADLVLFQPNEIKNEFGDEQLVRNALKNCLAYIESSVPNLNKLANLRCESSSLYVERVLYAACLEIYRAKKSLEEVKTNLLKALRTNLDIHYGTVTEEERKDLKKEIDRLLFPNAQIAEKFLRDFIEPQLAVKDCKYTPVSWLRYDDVFKPLQPLLPLEWLLKYPDIDLDTIGTLFDLAAQFGNRQKLEKLIKMRCEEIKKILSEKEEGTKKLEGRENFWFIRAFFFLSDGEINEYWNFLKTDKNTIFSLSNKSEGARHGGHPYWPILSPKKIWNILDSFIEQWPRVDLPNSWGTSSPPGEIAYRFLTDIIWILEKNISGESFRVVNQLIEDQRFIELHSNLKSIRSSIIRKDALTNFEAPEPQAVVKFLDNNEVATVEGLRVLILEELTIYQKDLNGGETTTKDIFYNIQNNGNKERLGEVEATKRVADRLKSYLERKGIVITLEHQMQHSNRCDITCTKVINNQRRLLVIESKGQWHKDLYNAASKQLNERYSIHPDAERQGIYLVLWFGADEKVANKINKTFQTAEGLKKSIESGLPTELKGLIDIFVLDVSIC